MNSTELKQGGSYAFKVIKEQSQNKFFRVTTDDGEGETPLYELIGDGGNSFESFEDNDSLRSEIEKLDPTEKQVVALRFVQGKSQSETGKILGVSQMFVSRAEKKIVEKLKDALL